MGRSKIACLVLFPSIRTRTGRLSIHDREAAGLAEMQFLAKLVVAGFSPRSFRLPSNIWRERTRAKARDYKPDRDKG
jgi:hypothetical protein